METAKKSFPCRIKDLGLIDYSSAYQIQQALLPQVVTGDCSYLLFCEHTPVFTMGRIATDENILFSKDQFKEKGADILRIDRGGEITFHGPGQLVIYPLFQLFNLGKDLKVYLYKLEQVAIDLLQHFGIVAIRIPGQRGVWVKNQKIASIGIGVRRWVSYHGMAVNINTDLDYFSMIKPCGLDVQMTSLSKLKNQTFNLEEIKGVAANCFSQIFELDFIKE